MLNNDHAIEKYKKKYFPFIYIKEGMSTVTPRKVKYRSVKLSALLIFVLVICLAGVFLVSPIVVNQMVGFLQIFMLC